MLNIWRLLRKELKLPTYTQHMCCLQVQQNPYRRRLILCNNRPSSFVQVLQRRMPQFPPHLLARWMKGISKSHASFGLQAVAVTHPLNSK